MIIIAKYIVMASIFGLGVGGVIYGWGTKDALISILLVLVNYLIYFVK